MTCSDSRPPAEEHVETTQALQEGPEQSFTLYAANSIAIGQSARVTGTKIGVRSTGGGPKLVPGYELAVGSGARIPSPLFAETIRLDSNSVAGEIYADELAGAGEHGFVHPFEPVPDLLSIVVPQAGTEPLTVPSGHDIAALPAGSYGAVQVENATLRLAGGAYHWASLTLGTHSRLEALAPARIVIAGRLATAESAYIGPSAGSGPVALNLTIDVAGKNGETGLLGETPRAAVIGAQNQVSAVIVAPNGTLEIGAGTRATGAFFGQEVDIGTGVEIDGVPGIRTLNLCVIQLCKFMNVTGQVTIDCTPVPVPKNASCADGNLCNGNETCDGFGTCTGVRFTWDDQNPCTIDWCDPKSGDIHHDPLPAGSYCDDGNPCTRVDSCGSTGSCSGTPQPDGAACSEDLCHPAACAAGSCTPGPSVLLDDGDPHTIDACDPVTGKAAHADCLSALDLTVATNLARAGACLYAGEAPLQKMEGQPFPADLDPFGPEAPFDPTTIAMLRGRVSSAKGGMPLSGVTISMLEQRQAGSTVTRSDGIFDMAIAGGGPVAVVYKKEGFLPVHRQVSPGWQEHAMLPDVVMIRRNDHAMPVDLNGSEMQVARGDVGADEDGLRQATLLFKANTKATMTLPGQTEPVEIGGTVYVRLTEFTVGENGPLQMPAALPATSGYTYAADLSIDEAVAAGATRVDFDKPVAVYLENFIGFEVGQGVPAGYYDAEKAKWVPSENGRVIRIESIMNDVAEVDTTGGLPGVEALQIDLAERKKLASLYSPGQTLWRIPIKHFSAWDFNWSYGPPDSATYPDDTDPKADNAMCDSCTQSGSIIEAENQTLGESFAIAGTPYTLNYTSAWQPGRATFLDIPIEGKNDELQGVLLRVDIAGQSTKQKFLNPPGVFQVAWDNSDGFGKFVQGAQPFQVEVGYVYKCIYRAGFFGSSGGPETWTSGERSICQNTLWRRWKGTIGHWNAIHEGLGGMTLDVHHRYDPMGRTLYLGDGQTRRGDAIAATITSVAKSSGSGCDTAMSPTEVVIARDGTIYIADAGCGMVRRMLPGGPMETIAFGNVLGHNLIQVSDVVLGPEGSVYFTDTTNHRLLKRNADGTFELMAGNGVFCPVQSPPHKCGDGGPANQAQLHSPAGLAEGSDGSIYIADEGNHRVRRIAPDGMIETVAGNGENCELCPLDDANKKATEQSLPKPRDVEVGSDGSLYIADVTLNRIRHVRPDGSIRTVAGNGTSGHTGDGGPATDAGFAKPHGIALAPDGALYIADSGDTENGRIRRVEKGIIRTVAGGAPPEPSPSCCGSTSSGCFCGDNGAATAANLVRPKGVTVAPDGTFYIADYHAGQLYRVVPALPGLSLKTLAIASEDASSLYEFDEEGKHLRTVDALTGKELYTFAYDQGRLASLTDPDGRVTAIHRHGDGKPDYIQGPFGHITDLELDDLQYIKTITSPAGTVHLEYSHTTSSGTQGLLTKLTDPKGYEYSFEYTGAGRLKKHSDPVETKGFREFKHQYLTGNTGFKVDAEVKTTDNPLVPMYTTTYQSENLPSGAQKRTVVLPGGLSAETLVEPNGTRTTTYPDGTKTTLIDKGDQRFGMQAPVVSLLETQNGALKQTIEHERKVEPLSGSTVEKLTDTVRINSRTFTETIDLTTVPATITKTTAAGRKSVTELDADGHPIKVTVGDPVNDPIKLYPTVYSYYDAGLHKGRLYTVAQGTGSDARVSTLFYNDQGHLDSIQDPMSRWVELGYENDRLKTKTLPDGNIVELLYDANGNVTTVVPPRPPLSPLPLEQDRHRLDYGPLDFLGKYTPPKVDDWLPGDTAVSYTPDRLVDWIKHPPGWIINSHYDDVSGRLKGITFPDLEELIYSYYAASDQNASHRGKLHTVTSTRDDVDLTYTYAGSLLESSTWSGTVSGSVHVGYDNSFRVTSETVSGSDPIAFVYDDHNGQVPNADGLLVQAGALALDWDQKTGVLKGTTIGKLKDTYTYNSFGELKEYKMEFLDSGNIWKPKYSVHYSKRDALGRVEQKAESVNAEAAVYHQYEYSLTGELTDVYQGSEPCDQTQTTCVHTGHYEYSLNGNRTLVQHGTGPTISDIQHDLQDQLTKYGEATYFHYANGERSQKTVLGQGKTDTVYDVLGNLRSVTLPDLTHIEYIIDGANRRVGKKVNGSLVKRWLYSGSVPVAEFDQNDVMTRFVYATKAHVPDYMTRAAKIYRLITDQLGSVRLVVDVQDGSIAQRIDYDEFGRVLFESTNGFQPFGFAGDLYDSDTGLARFGARDYDAEIGRWMAKDPILFAGGDTNLYAYAGNDPVNFIDPDGLRIQNAAMTSALGGGVLSWLGFSTIAEGLKNRSDGMLAMSNAATFERGLAQYRQGICQIGAGTLQAAGTMTAIAGVIQLGTALAAGRAGLVAERAGNVARACFIGDTSVLTREGYVPIDRVQVGDDVWSYNDDAGEWSWKVVERTFVHDYEGEIVALEANGETIEATANHPFCVLSGEGLWQRAVPLDVPQQDMRCGEGGRWVEADDLQMGDSLASQGGGGSFITVVSSYSASLPVYNVEVIGTHTYAVSKTGILVHNKAAVNKSVKEAEQALRTNRDFRTWLHREFKPSQVQSRGGRTNPDMVPDQILEAFEEWLALGRPKVK